MPEGSVVEDLRTALFLLRPCVAEVDPGTLSTDAAAMLVQLFADIEHVAAAGKLLFTPRAADSSQWLHQGHRSPAHWLAEVNGGSLGEAMGALDTAYRLGHLPETTDALRRGELSPAQTKEIASAAAKNPSAERDLLQSAAHDSFRQLKDKARQAKAAAASQLTQAQREEQIRRARYLRSYTDEEGGLRLDARLTAEAGAAVLSALEVEANHVFDEAWRAGIEETPGACLADALVNLVTRPDRTSKSGRRPAAVNLRVDLAALRRGSLEEGELCQIPGVGPVSLATARNLIGDSFVKLIVTDGVDVQCVTHLGRTVPAGLRSALEERDPVCVVPGCGIARGLEIDHWQVPFAQGGATELWNLVRLCTHHHRMKTHSGYELIGGPGHWEFRRPDRLDQLDGRDPHDPPDRTGPAEVPRPGDALADVLQFDGL